MRDLPMAVHPNSFHYRLSRLHHPPGHAEAWTAPRQVLRAAAATCGTKLTLPLLPLNVYSHSAAHTGLVQVRGSQDALSRRDPSIRAFV